MRRQHGRKCVRLLIVRVLTRFCVAANASATAATTCRPSLICLTLLTMISSTASRPTPVTYYSHICLTRSIYLTNFEPVHTDDTQVYGLCRPSATLELQNSISTCIDDVARWMRSNRLQLNTAETPPSATRVTHPSEHRPSHASFRCPQPRHLHGC